jgi:LSD1 subclass zinc finger protein
MSSVCSACSAPVSWAVFPDRVTRPIEPAPEGDGDVALQPTLPGLDPKPRRHEARMVSGVRTRWRLHLATCPRAHIYRTRWQLELACVSCRAPMVALEGGRSVCATCQAAERRRLAELADALAALGGEAARAVLAEVERGT